MNWWSRLVLSKCILTNSIASSAWIIAAPPSLSPADQGLWREIRELRHHDDEALLELTRSS